MLAVINLYIDILHDIYDYLIIWYQNALVGALEKEIF